MGYDRHAGHAGIFGRAAKSSYDGTRKSAYSGGGPAMPKHNPFKAGYGSGRHRTPETAGHLYINNHKSNAKSGAGAGRSAKEIASPSNSAAIAQRTVRQKKQLTQSWGASHPQHPNYRTAIARGPNKRIVGV